MSLPLPPSTDAADARHADALLDEALAASFPASDPVALSVATSGRAARSGPAQQTNRPLDEALAGLLADLTALWFKTKSFHWHVSGPSFRDMHLLFDEQASEVLAAIDPVAERLRKRSAMALMGIGEVAARSGVVEEARTDLTSQEMVRRLLEDHVALLARLAAARRAAETEGDEATASRVDDWTDEAEERAWFLRATLSED